MGCFTMSKSNKKKPDKSVSIKRVKQRQDSPTVLPEPQTRTRSLQSAPPSFKTQVTEPAQSDRNKIISGKTRALSAPLSFNNANTEQDTFTSTDRLLQEGPKIPFGSSKDYYSSPIPQPLPLPSPSSALKAVLSFKMMSHSGKLNMSGPLPLPPTLPSTNKGMLVDYSFDEIASACNNFSPEGCLYEGLSSVIYRASFEDNTQDSNRPLEATVTVLHHSEQGFKEFVNEVNTFASLQHQSLCKLIGFHAREGSDKRMIVFERLYHGSLDRLLHGRCDGPPVDWNSRMKFVLCAAQGLAFLHEECPFQAMFHEFSTSNIQIEKDFSAKLSGYGCIGRIPETDISSNSAAMSYVSVETLERGLLTPKSNVWSFGIVLLELLTGRKNLDSCLSKEERNLVKWTRPYLSDDSRLSLIMDPHLKGRFPSKAARIIADLAQKCLQADPSDRPTMRTIVECLKTIQDIKFTSMFPLQEPQLVNGKGKYMARSASLDGIIHPVPRSSHSKSLISKTSVSLNRVALPLPPKKCSSMLSLEDMDRQDSRRIEV